MRGLRAEMGWPAWWWVPMSGAHAVVSGGEQIAGSDPRSGDIALLATLAAWRQGRGIYRCARARQGPGGHRPDGALPVDVLYRLPEWCVYKSGMGTDAYAHLEWDVTHARPELRALHAEDGWPSVARPPRPPDTGRGHRVDAGPRPRPSLLRRGIGAHLPDDGVAQLIELVRPVVAAVLYPCSAEADVIDPDRRQAR